MRLGRIRRRARIVGMGLSALASIYGRDRSLRKIIGEVWFVATREGLIGVRRWLIQSAPLHSVSTEAFQHEIAATPPPALPEQQPEAEAVLPPASDPQRLYEEWLERFDLSPARDLAPARRHLATLDLPELLFLAVVTQESVAQIGRIVAGWQSSIHQRWHAVLVPASTVSDAERAVLAAAVAAEPRIAIAATAAEVEAARGRSEYMLLCRGNVVVNPWSGYMLLEAAVRTGADIVYSDHDTMDAIGRRSGPAFKPQFSPEYLARYNYIGDCLLLSRSVPLTPGQVASLLEPTASRFDRLVAQLAPHRRVEHVPFTLFHVFDPAPRTPHDLPAIPDTGPSVAIIIPTRDGLDHLAPCIDSIVRLTSYDRDKVEIIVVDNNSVEPATLDYLAELAARPRFTVLPYPQAFNFAEINNVGARASTQDVLVFLNNDTTVHDPAWLSKLVAYASQPGVGMVGGKLLFPDGSVQHGGCVAGASMGTVQHLLSSKHPAEVAAADHTREMSIVTGACVAVRREVFNQVGGFDPILRITWNDVKTCLECLCAGLRNIYVADPLLTHDESKTRGHDNTRERYVRYFSEADYTRRRFRGFFYDDPSYNPNLSLEDAGQLAEPPRTRRPWFRLAGEPARILVLSTVYRIGFGVPVVIYQQVLKLKQLGYDVIIGGPVREEEFTFAGCERVILNSVREATSYAFMHGVALVISHTPPFFDLPILIGGHIPVLAYDYGEPGAEFFSEPTRSYLLEVGYRKRGAAALTTKIATISQAVKDETLNKDALVVGLANSHLPAWSEAFRPDRDRVRGERQWSGAFVVLTVCRFSVNERSYKGLDKIAAILREFPYLYPEQSKTLVWVLAGAGAPDDVEQAEQLGFTVLPNVSDELLADLYKAADGYMSFSKWEGYNLGISQALAMGLPTIGSDIPAHREFPIKTTNSVLAASEWLAGEVVRRTAATAQRRATVYEWEDSTTKFAKVVTDMLDAAKVQAPRIGASGRVWQDMAACPP